MADHGGRSEAKTQKRGTWRLPCEEFTSLASLKLEHKISWWDHLRMLWHKIECVYCRRFIVQLRRIRGLLAKPPAGRPMPAAMKERIRRKLEG